MKPIVTTVRHATRRDLASWLQLRCALWPDGTTSEHGEEICRFFDGTFPREPWAVLLAEDASQGAVGLTELSIRPFTEGCRSSQVAYLEGWFVVPTARGRGVGRALVAAAERWARSHGCTEFASDTQPDNSAGSAAHRAVGFTDAGLTQCFRKDL